MESIWSFINWPLAACYLIKVMKRYEPDRLLITSAVAHEYAALARVFSLFRFTLVVHGTEVCMHFSKKGRRQCLKSRLMRWFFHKSDGIICVSHSTQDFLQQAVSGLRDRSFLIYYGINLNEFSRKKSPKKFLKQFNLINKKIILTVARLSGGKGQDVVIQALPRVLGKIPDVRYVIVGGGCERPKLEKIVEEKRLEEAVIFTGPLNHGQTGSFYHACDIFVMPSRRGKRESFGIVFLEAWAYEKPVIGGNVGGVTEVIEDGKTGLLVDPNDVDGVADAICRLLENEDLAKAMGKLGCKKAKETFSRNSMAQQTLDLLQLD